MTESYNPSWCQELHKLSDRELTLLVDSVAAVLTEQAGGDEDIQEIRDLPTAVLAPDLAEMLMEMGVRADQQEIQRLAEDNTSNRALATALLEQVCSVPVLCVEVDAAYAASQRMMIIDPVTITAVSVLLLVMKLRRVRVGREGVEVTLDPIREGMLGFIKGLIGGG